MSRCAVDLSDHAERDLDALSPDVGVRIGRRLRELAENPFPRGDTIKRLQGFDIPKYRFRVGDYRAVYEIQGSKVYVLRVVHRSQLDRALRDLV